MKLKLVELDRTLLKSTLALTTTRIVRGAVAAFVWVLFWDSDSRGSELAAARATVAVEELRSHVDFLAADALEGREAGKPGGAAAARYIQRLLEEFGLQPGEGESYQQAFGNGYHNILAYYPGASSSGEYIILCAHYDHVGYGTSQNSFGPIGRIHNGADDNASGTAVLLEVAEALAETQPRLQRGVLFAFWDAEEKGLLGSKHWLDEPTQPLDRLVCCINLDMVGRYRDDVEVWAWRTSPGFRSLMRDANTYADAPLSFLWKAEDNSDHYEFLRNNVPAVMIHTGLHDNYHRPSDDVEYVNFEGMKRVADLTTEMVLLATDANRTFDFRDEGVEETPDDARVFRQKPAPLPPRLGLSWREQEGRLVVTAVRADSSAVQAGLRVGDELISIDGEPLVEGEALRRAVLAAEKEIDLVWRSPREEGDRAVKVALAGSPIRIGFSWRQDAADPGSLVLSRVVPGTSAAAAGLEVRDRILSIAGVPAAGPWRLTIEGAETAEVIYERGGRTKKTTLTLISPE